MDFEHFADTHDKGKLVSHHDKVRGTTAGQASRRDANADPAAGMRFESYREEFDHLKGEKMRLQEELTAHFSKAAFTEAQAKVRRERPGDSLRPWLDLRSQMQRRRNDVVARIQQIDARLVQLRPRVRQEADEADAEGGAGQRAKVDLFRDMVTLFGEMRDVLVDIRGLLREGHPRG